MDSETKKRLKKKKEKIKKKNLSIITEFKEFALRGSVVDMAVGVVIGAAFGAITNTLVNNIILPLVSGLSAGVDFKDLMFEVGAAKVQYGLFLQAIVNFFVIAASIFFVIKIFNAILRKPKDNEPEVNKELDVLIEIRDRLDVLASESEKNASEKSTSEKKEEIITQANNILSNKKEEDS